jgi:hypothetical protein
MDNWNRIYHQFLFLQLNEINYYISNNMFLSRNANSSISR